MAARFLPESISYRHSSLHARKLPAILNSTPFVNPGRRYDYFVEWYDTLQNSQGLHPILHRIWTLYKALRTP